MTDHQDLNLSGQTVTQSFAGDTFKGTTNFAGVIFTGEGGKFQGAVFEGPVDFTGAKFECKTVDFSDAVFLSGTNFNKAQFGKDYQRIFGDLEIQFSASDNIFCIKTTKAHETVKKWDPTFFNALTELNYSIFLKNDNDHIRLIQAFQNFCRNPKVVSFEGCRFGAMRLDGFSAEQIKEVIEKENAWVKKKFPNNNKYKAALEAFRLHNFSSDSSLSEIDKTSLMSILARHLGREDLNAHHLDIGNNLISFIEASFYPQAEVSFKNSVLLHDESIYFSLTKFSSGSGVDFSKTTFNNKGSINFSFATFSNGEHVNFSSATFNNNGVVNFTSARFSNGWNVDFSSTTFNNNGDVSFSSAIFTNGTNTTYARSKFNNFKTVDFSKTTFHNGNKVSFRHVVFCNKENVNLSNAIFNNGENISFFSITFNNGNDVSFKDTTFGNKGKLFLSQIIWINGGSLFLRFKEFRESLPVKFDECLFLSARDIYFKEARYPEKGSLMFQRCYFGRSAKVDFTGTFFRHTSFEGGEIFWLKESPEKALRERLGEKYDSLPDKTKKQLGTGVTPVFEKGVEVFWKDFTTESAKNLTLRRVNLSHSLFDGMTLSHIQLNAPKWYEKDGRRYLYEEIKLREKKEISKFDLENIEDQYTQLKNNLEKQGNYLNAGYFHCGEQEIRREILRLEENKSWPAIGRNTALGFMAICYKGLSKYENKQMWFSKSLEIPLGSLALRYKKLAGNGDISRHKHNTGLYSKLRNLTLRFLSWSYKWCSGYGENPGLALAITLLIISVCSLSLAVWNTSASPFLSKWIMGFIEIITPFSWKSSKSLEKVFDTIVVNSPGRIFFLIISQLGLSVLLSLLVLAVRRQFKR